MSSWAVAVTLVPHDPDCESYDDHERGVYPHGPCRCTRDARIARGIEAVRGSDRAFDYGSARTSDDAALTTFTTGSAR